MLRTRAFLLASYIADLTTHKPIKIRVIKKFESRTRQDANESLFELRAWCKAIMAEVSPEPNLTSGYDDKFVEPLNEDLQCGICKFLMRDPMITRCGHHFCRECIEEHLRRYCDLCRGISRMVFLVILIVNS